MLFWMWVSAFTGMATKYSEVLLAVKFRVRNAAGERAGGPMYYIRDGLSKAWRPLAYIFALAGALAAFGMGSAVPSGEIRSALSTLCTEVNVNVGDDFPLAIGLVVAILAAAVLLGGASRLGSVTGLLVPFMSLAYIAACVAVLCVNCDRYCRALKKSLSRPSNQERLSAPALPGVLGAALFPTRPGLAPHPWPTPPPLSVTACVRAWPVYLRFSQTQ